ncbi:GSCOCG00013494001-RA-CDS [Cotesia congregata]|nr:GSCOCG00013494001-RA-CDS [Cotesia congregata]
MIIKTSCPDFEPENFEILDFYNTKTVFVWQNDQFVYFPLTTLTSAANLPAGNLKLIKAPSGIKKLKSYKERVFFICEPRGIYKFVINNNIETFRIVSSTGVEIAEEFYKNLCIKDNFLWLQNKQEKYSNELFFLNQSIKIDQSNSKNIDRSKSKNFDQSNFELSRIDSRIDISNSRIDINSIKINLNEAGNLKKLITDKDICLIANNYLLYKFIDNKTELIYESTYKLTDFVVIRNKNNKIIYLLLKTSNPKLLILITENLDFKKIFFNCEINNCVGFIEENEDCINLVIGGDKIYFVTLKVSTGGVTYHSYLNKAFKALRIVEDKVWGLKAAGEMAEVAQGFNKMADQDGDEFFELRSSMCSGTSVIVDNICDLSKELKVKNEKLLIEQDKLKRINIYAHKSKLLGIKKIWVERTSSFIFLKATFEGTLPRDCWIRVGVSCKEQEFFTMQLVEDGKIVAELPLPLDFFDSTAEVCLDLVTLVEEDQPWFVVKDCEKKATAKEKETLRSLMEKKRNLLNTKLGVLRTGDGDEDRFKKICYVKKSLRREIPDF